MLAACAVGPNYQAPRNVATKDWKEASAENKGAIQLQQKWWELFADAKLNELEEEALKGNFQLQAAAARVRQARAIARVSEADLLPTRACRSSTTWRTCNRSWSTDSS